MTINITSLNVLKEMLGYNSDSFQSEPCIVVKLIGIRKLRIPPFMLAETHHMINLSASNIRVNIISRFKKSLAMKKNNERRKTHPSVSEYSQKTLLLIESILVSNK